MKAGVTGFTVLLTRRGVARARVWELSKFSRKGRLARAEPGTAPKIFGTLKAARAFLKAGTALSPKVAATIVGPKGEMIPFAGRPAKGMARAVPSAPLASLCLPPRTERRLESAGLATVGQVAVALASGEVEAIDERDEAAIRRALPPTSTVPPRRLRAFDVVESASGRFVCRVKAKDSAAALIEFRRLGSEIEVEIRPRAKERVACSS